MKTETIDGILIFHKIDEFKFEFIWTNSYKHFDS